MYACDSSMYKVLTTIESSDRDGFVGHNNDHKILLYIIDGLTERVSLTKCRAIERADLARDKI